MRKRKKGFTLVEMLVVFLISAIVLALFYDMHFMSMIRYWAVTRRIEGEQAVRILLTRIRQELRAAVGLVTIDKQGKQLTIPLRDSFRVGKDAQGNEVPLIYQSQYEFDPAEKTIWYRKLDAQGSVIEQRLWLGGRAMIENFLCMATSENDRILFQYYRVIIEVDYYDVKAKDRKKVLHKQADGKLIHATCTVYPRFINQELRIEVPQEGGCL